jgi:hypothetical protein
MYEKSFNKAVLLKSTQLLNKFPAWLGQWPSINEVLPTGNGGAVIIDQLY